MLGVGYHLFTKIMRCYFLASNVNVSYVDDKITEQHEYTDQEIEVYWVDIFKKL